MFSRLINLLKRILGTVLLFFFEAYIRLQWRLFSDYHQRLILQAHYIYRTSDRFKERWRCVDLEYAEEQFSSEAYFYYKQVKSGPRIIRFCLFWDSLLGKEKTVYCLEEN
jgi:hypothetical protein